MVMYIANFLIVVLLSFFVLIVSFSDFGVPPETVEELDLGAFTGRWYQMYASLIPTLTYEKGGYCIYSDYSNASVLGRRAFFDLLNGER